MKTKILAILICFAVLNSFAQTSIPSGNVSGTWTLFGSPYNIQGSIMIPNDSTLTIEPGVTVNFQSNYQLQVNGRLLAIGTANDTITFIATNTTLGWQGIRFPSTAASNDTSKIIYCKLEYGYATGTSSLAHGGALNFTNFSKAIVSNCVITNCRAKYNGGGIYCENSSIIISKNIITNNKGNTNGSSGSTGDFGGGGIYCKNSNPVIFDNIISNNQGYAGGAGIACWYSNPSISNNIITNNSFYSVVCWGGAIYCWYSNPTISNNTISNNSAGEGGAFYCYNSDPIISNNTITNNSSIPVNSNAHGGGFYLINSSPTITNNTIANNDAFYGGVLYCDNNSNPTFRNCILWGNTASNLGAQVFLNDEGSDPNFNYCNVQGGSVAFELNGNFHTGMYQNNIDTNPLFVTPSGGSGNSFNGVSADWSLQNTSSCINTGDPLGTYPATDKAGNNRVMGGRIDMGAYEYQGVVDIMNFAEQNNDVKIYPNPFSNSTTIKIINSQQGIVNYNFKIYDIIGQAIHEQTLNSKQETLNLSLSIGIYFYKIVNEKQETIGKGKLIRQ